MPHRKMRAWRMVLFLAALAAMLFAALVATQWILETAAALSQAMGDVLQTESAHHSESRAKRSSTLREHAARLREELRPIEGEGLGL